MYYTGKQKNKKQEKEKYRRRKVLMPCIHLKY